MVDATAPAALDTAVRAAPLPEPCELPPWWLTFAGPAGVRTGTFRGFDAEDRFLVCVGTEAAPLPAASTIDLREQDIGCQVVLAFQGGDMRQPIVMGRLQQRARPAGGALRVEAERVLVHAGRELELRCGEASIVLTRAGKVLIQGTHISSRSKGANRIKGAHVDIN